MMSLSEREKQNALNEIRLLASIKHPNIVEYKESFIDEYEKCLCLVMEYADDGDLS
jgi:NIMA (never in mitosis gene a)-related kinase